jgi:putative two-component system response regulator
MNANSKSVILIVDGAADHLVGLANLLQGQYEIRSAASAAEALPLAQQLPRPDLVLVDVQPDGYTLCQQLKGNPDTAAIAVVFLVERGDDGAAQRAYAEGAAEVLARPFLPETLLARVATQLQLRQACRLLKEQDQRMQELAAMVDAGLWALATLAETRNVDNSLHLQRMQHYVGTLARRLQQHPRFAAELADGQSGLLALAAPLHDIGKVRIPDAILLKPGRLTPAEFTLMKRHTEFGRDAIIGIEQRIGGSNTFLRFAREITYSHQEKYDGSGYPLGLAGDAIPVAARMVAVADVYDSLISQRVYRPAFTHETSIELIRQGSGEHFDPDVVDAMLACEEEFMDIARRYQDATK